MNKQQRKFHKEIKHRQKRAAKIRGGMCMEASPAPIFEDNRTVEEKIAGDMKLAKKMGLLK